MVISCTLNVLKLTVSSNLKVMVPVFRSKSNARRLGETWSTPNEDAMRGVLGDIGEFRRPFNPMTTNEVKETNVISADSASPPKLWIASLSSSVS